MQQVYWGGWAPPFSVGLRYGGGGFFWGGCHLGVPTSSSSHSVSVGEAEGGWGRGREKRGEHWGEG